jgi:hypothetical protein
MFPESLVIGLVFGGIALAKGTQLGRRAIDQFCKLRDPN